MLSRSRARLRASALIITAGSLLGTFAFAAPANAGSWRSQVPAYAAQHKGDPYEYGAAGPTRFDCSGLTMYVYAHFGKRLPHNAAEQYADMHHEPQDRKVPGDLLFFRNSEGRISHVGIYAGGDNMWHAPHSGSVVQLIQIYSSDYLVGRL